MLPQIMKPLNWLIVIVVLLNFSGCTREDGSRKGSGTLSIYAILGDSKAYHGQLVLVTGFFQFQQEAIGLFPSAETARYGDFASGVWVYLDGIEAVSLDGQWVVIHGVFSASDRGHGGAYAGSLRSVNIFPAGPPLYE